MNLDKSFAHLTANIYFNNRCSSRHLALSFALLTILVTTAEAQITLLHEFAGGANDGRDPFANLTASGTTLFGTTFAGGDNDLGTIFSMNTDGTSFQLLHEFAGGSNDGRRPEAALTLSGSTLYGTTLAGGDTDIGTVFSINTDGTGFQLLHEFAGGANDGRAPEPGPEAALVLSGSTLYGTTVSGGDSNRGTIFSIDTDGTDFQLLHEFAGGPNDGRSPFSGLIASGTTLFGTTFAGGDNDLGTIFSMNTDGTSFQLLHEFAGGSNDGRRPEAALTLSGSTLYGTTLAGGDTDIGTVFSINTDGTGFQLLHEFAGGANDGKGPQAGVVLSGSTLYGTTFENNVGDSGTIYSVNTDGTGFQLLHAFAGGVNDGRNPEAGLILNGTNLFGTTDAGGDSDWGTVYSLPIIVPEPSALTQAFVVGLLLIPRWPRRVGSRFGEVE